jgi:hypothetical protein
MYYYVSKQEFPVSVSNFNKICERVHRLHREVHKHYRYVNYFVLWISMPENWIFLIFCGSLPCLNFSEICGKFMGYTGSPFMGLCILAFIMNEWG